MADKFEHFTYGMESPARRTVPVTLGGGDIDLSDDPPRAIYIGSAGDLYIDDMAGNTDVGHLGLLAGTWLPVRATRIDDGATDADDLVLWY